MSTTSYAICLDCPEEFANNAEMSSHFESTLKSSRGSGGGSSHSCRVVNPTPEEAVARRVRSDVMYSISSAMDEAFNSLFGQVERGELTTGQVSSVLADYPDFGDGWLEYVAEVSE